MELEAGELVRPSRPALRNRQAEAGFTSCPAIVSADPKTRVLANAAGGAPLSHGAQISMGSSVPGKYFWKSAKGARGLIEDSSSADKPGFGSATATTNGRRSLARGPVRVLATRIPSSEGSRSRSVGPSISLHSLPIPRRAASLELCSLLGPKHT